MTTNADAVAKVLLDERAKRAKVVDRFLGRTRWDRLMVWLPAPVTVAVFLAWNAWTVDSTHQWVALAALAVAALWVAQARTERRLKALGRILEQDGTLDRFMAP